MSDREVIAKRLNDAGLLENRFIAVRDGEKGSPVDHTEPVNRYSNFAALDGNYGVYAGPNPEGTKWLVDVDIDDYGEDTDDDALEAVLSLPETFTVASPHTDGENGGHRYYAVECKDLAEQINELAGAPNPKPSWGELRVQNQYVVGPGSELDGCDKEWCDECATDEGGHYTVASDAEIAEIRPEDLLDVLRADGYDGDDESADLGDYKPDESDESRAKKVAQHDDKIRRYLAFGAKAAGFRSGGGGDRSDADLYACCRMIEYGVPKAQARDLLGRNSNTKVYERGSKYWRQTWQEARERVGSDADSKSLPSETGATEGDDLPKPPRRSNLVERNGGYYRKKVTPDGETKHYKITNFQLEVLSRLKHDDGTRQYHLRVHPKHGDPYEVTVEPVVFNEVRTFKREVPTSWNTTFEGGQKELNLLKEFVGQQDVKERAATRLVGLHGDEWVTPAGSLTADGWADDPATVFVGEDSPIKNKWGLTPSEGADYDRETVARILRVLPRTRDYERFLPVLGWFYAAPLRPLIMGWEGEFNILNVLGDTGAGKTATLEAVWQAFGMEDELLRADGTPFPIMKALASSNALPVVLDEYKPSDIRDSRLDKLHSYLRTSTRGGIEQKGNPDMSVDSYHLQAPVCVVGEQPLQGPAEERRSVLTTFTREATVESGDYTRAFIQLVGGEFGGEHYDGLDLHEHALAYYQWILLLDSDALYDRWIEARERVMDLLTRYNRTGLDDIVIQGYQTVTFGCRLYRCFAREMGVDPDETTVTEDAVEETILYLAEEGSGAEHHSHLDRFVGLIARAADADYLQEDEHYVVKNRSRGRTTLVIDLNTGFDQVRRYARDHDISGEDLLDNLGDYRGRIRDAEERNESYIMDRSKKTREIGRGVAIDVPLADEQVPAFTVRRFTEPDDIVNAKGQVGRYLMDNYESGDSFTLAELAGELSLDPESVEYALGELIQNGTLATDGDEYEVL